MKASYNMSFKPRYDKSFRARQHFHCLCQSPSISLQPACYELRRVYLEEKLELNLHIKPLTLTFSVAFLNRRDQFNSINQIEQFTSLCI